MKPKIIRCVTVAQSLSFFTNISNFKENYEIIVLSAPGKEVDPFCYKEKIEHIPVKMERRIKPIHDLKSLYKLIKIFHSQNPTLVHSMTPKAGLLCMMAAWITGVPVRVHTFTGLVFPTSSGIKRKILMLTDWLTCAFATHIIPEGEGVKRDLLNNGITKKDIRVLGYGNVKGINLEKFDLSKEVKENAAKIKNPDVFTFISVGRLVGDKGINELVEAFKRLNLEIPKTRLVLVGDYEANLDPLKPETIYEIENNHSILSPGRQTDVRPWYASSDCAVLASYREGFPNVVIEAGAMRLPQIVTDINGANEIIIEGKNGTIVPSKDVESLYRTMKRMIEDTEWRKKLASNARTMIASRYEESYVQKCLLDFYDSILN